MTIQTQAETVLVVGLTEIDGDPGIWRVETSALQQWLESRNFAVDDVAIIDGTILKSLDDKELPTAYKPAAARAEKEPCNCGFEECDECGDYY